ncbi:MAG: hypothetical protein HQL94_00625, partial [Magnetococcales bacterium]|nr:hypothetical protein [Magnetococcales bacterium]
TWPGNVRELENLIERLTILSEGEVQFDDLPPKIRLHKPTAPVKAREEVEPNIKTEDEADKENETDGESDCDLDAVMGVEAVTRMITSSTQDINQKIEQGLDFNGAVASFENQLIISALESTGWNKNKAARLLNLNRTTLVEKIKKKGLERLERPERMEE